MEYSALLYSDVKQRTKTLAISPKEIECVVLFSLQFYE
jgi:hypothetical protein